MATPGCDLKQSQKTLTWAIQSAQRTTTPTLSILALPLPTRKESQKKYDTVMQNAQAWCRPLLTLRQGFTSDTQGNAPFQHPTKSRWGLYIVCVGNGEGFDTFGPQGDDQKWLFTLSKDCTQELNNLHRSGSGSAGSKIIRIQSHPRAWVENSIGKPDPKASRVAPAQPLLPASKAFKRARPDTDTTTTTTLQPNGWTTTDLKRPVPMETYPPPNPRYDWRSFYYTDGSAITQADKGVRIAAAV